MGFKLKTAEEAAGTANNVATAAGYSNTLRSAATVDRAASPGASLASRGQSLAGRPSSPLGTAINVAGGALSALALGSDISDMVSNGIGAENAVSASGNLAGLLGAVVPGVPGLVAGAYSTGSMVGQVGNSFIRDTGLLGEKNRAYESAGNRGWDDMAADWGRSTRRALGGGVGGQLAGGAATLAGSAIGAAGAAGSFAVSTASAAKSMVGSAGSFLLDAATSGITAPKPRAMYVEAPLEPEPLLSRVQTDAMEDDRADLRGKGWRSQKH
jgi:hypothetical protein